MRFVLAALDTDEGFRFCQGFNIIARQSGFGVEAAILTQFSSEGGSPASQLSGTLSVGRGFWDVIVEGLKPYGARTTGAGSAESSNVQVSATGTGAAGDHFCIWINAYDGSDAAFTGLANVTNGWTLLAGTDRTSTGANGCTGTWGWQEETAFKSISATSLTPNPPTDGWCTCTAIMYGGGSPPGAKLNVKAVDGVELAVASARDGVNIYE
jgi:hypothetical protein